MIGLIYLQSKILYLTKIHEQSKPTPTPSPPMPLFGGGGAEKVVSRYSGASDSATCNRPKHSVVPIIDCVGQI